jgi:hypothetical protein
MAACARINVATGGPGCVGELSGPGGQRRRTEERLRGCQASAKRRPSVGGSWGCAGGRGASDGVALLTNVTVRPTLLVPWYGRYGYGYGYG